MSQWSSAPARRVLTALNRTGWTEKQRAGGSHRVLSRQGGPTTCGHFHDKDEIGPRMLARIAKHTGLRPEATTLSPSLSTFRLIPSVTPPPSSVEIAVAARSLRVFAGRGRRVPEYDDPSIRELILRKYRLAYRVGLRRVDVLRVIRSCYSLSLQHLAPARPAPVFRCLRPSAFRTSPPIPTPKARFA